MQSVNILENENSIYRYDFNDRNICKPANRKKKNGILIHFGKTISTHRIYLF